MALGNERSSVQNPMIKYATDIGWQYIEPDEAIRLRAGDTGLVFRELFINQMVRLNPDFMDNILADGLIKKISGIQPNIEGNLMA